MATHHHHHLSKRPYNGSQPPITSYFSSPSPSLSTTSPSLSHRAPTTPPLPPDIQANLLSVGMRVRKAIPEGYKTGAYSAFTLFADENSWSSPLPLPEKRHAGVSGSGSRSAGNRPRARELTPFCGILKVGGMAQQQQQQWGIYSPNHRVEEEVEEEDDDLEDCPVLSQGSTVSNGNSYYGGYTGNGGNKRRFEEDDLEDERMNLGLGAGRLMAVPVPRRKKMEMEMGNRGKMVLGRGQENVAVVGVDGDFGEADFLDYNAVLGEVEMGGV